MSPIGERAVEAELTVMAVGDELRFRLPVLITKSLEPPPIAGRGIAEIQIQGAAIERETAVDRERTRGADPCRHVEVACSRADIARDVEARARRVAGRQRLGDWLASPKFPGIERGDVENRPEDDM